MAVPSVTHTATIGKVVVATLISSGLQESPPGRPGFSGWRIDRIAAQVGTRSRLEMAPGAYFLSGALTLLSRRFVSDSATGNVTTLPGPHAHIFASRKRRR